MRLRIGLAGTVLGLWPIAWCLYARNVAEADEPAARWVCSTLNGIPLREKHFSGLLFARLEDRNNV